MSAKASSGPAGGPGGAVPDPQRPVAPASKRTEGPADRPEAIRNVALVGHSGAGKTMLVEALLAATGAISRLGTIEDGTTVSDSDPSAIHQQRSVALSVVPVMLGSTKVNLLDTPGYPDFTGELRAGLRAADAVLFVVSAVEGLAVGTAALWGECERLGMPRVLVLSRLDHPRADYDGVLAACRQAFGSRVVPLYSPLRTDGGITGWLGLAAGRVSEYPGGSPRPATRDADAAEREASESDRAVLVESIIAEADDETLMDRYLDGEDVEPQVLAAALAAAVARGAIFPALGVSSLAGAGVAEVLAVLEHVLPSPVGRGLPAVKDLQGSPAPPVSCDPAGALVGEVVRTTIDPFLGRIALVRVFSGTLREDSAVHVSGRGLSSRGHEDHDSDERVTHLHSPLGAGLRPVPYCVAGDICALTRVNGAETGDTVSAKDAPLLIDPWDMPEPLLPIAVEALSRNDEDALAKSLGKLTASDPTLRVERNAETHQLVLWCTGEAHAEVVLDRLRSQGVKVATVEVVVPLRETFGAPAAGHGRYVKQSGGHGQFAVCDIDVEPLDRGAGFEFVDKIVGGVIPGPFVTSVEKGVRSQMQSGVFAGFPVVDIRVTLVGGKTHSVDSSDAAFQAAGALALREAAAAGRIQLLEPVAELAISVPEDCVGAVMSDLTTRRGRLTGTLSAVGGVTDISAEVPEQELLHYAVQLHALTAGAGRFRRSYLRHEPVPPTANSPTHSRP
ncbi:elongation factor G-like protein EF-G2 [Arthrobacter sp. 35W]|uniref:elongation factor G-like protein EF-G2 n=1 Tax=Arthrobacter sp. 35W TaxID=1132441 RepID=UPI0003FE56D1|nr:elongation factor G-like protein EF-G2 [Arthrobacter sp. 35W]